MLSAPHTKIKKQKKWLLQKTDLCYCDGQTFFNENKIAKQ